MSIRTVILTRRFDCAAKLRTGVSGLAFVLLISMTTNVLAAGVIALPQTGQTKCWDTAGVEIDCAGTGQDGEIRAGVPWPSPRWQVTYCDASGPCPDQTTDCDNNRTTDIVTDMLTGLTIPRVINPPFTGAYWDSVMDYANNFALCGHRLGEWALANVNQLEALIDPDRFDPDNPVSAAGVPWSSTRVTPKATQHAWAVSVAGPVGRYTRCCSALLGAPVPVLRTRATGPAEVPKTGQIYSYRTGDDGDLRLGVAWPVPRFTDQGTGVVTDNLTGLVWLKNANCIKTNYPGYDGDATAGDGNVTWQHALDFVQDINSGLYPDCSGGHRDWRLPNRKEIRSLIDYSAGIGSPIQSGHPFTNTMFTAFWTSTTATPRNTAFILDTADGYLFNYYEGPFSSYYPYPYQNSTKDKAAAVWPVRGPEVECLWDNDRDGDVDGRDLAALAPVAAASPAYLQSLAEEFGRSDCQ